MSDGMAALLMLGILGGLGVLMAGTGIVIFVIEQKKKRSCIGQVIGMVSDYSFRNGALYPIVEYVVNGVTYRKKKSYRAIITVQGFASHGKRSFVDEHDVLHIRRGSVLNLRELAKELYPQGACLPVWYDPQNPRRAYVERIPEKLSVCGLVFVWTGAGLIALGILLASAAAFF